MSEITALGRWCAAATKGLFERLSLSRRGESADPMITNESFFFRRQPTLHFSRKGHHEMRSESFLVEREHNFETFFFANSSFFYPSSAIPLIAAEPNLNFLSKLAASKLFHVIGTKNCAAGSLSLGRKTVLTHNSWHRAKRENLLD